MGTGPLRRSYWWNSRFSSTSLFNSPVIYVLPATAQIPAARCRKFPLIEDRKSISEKSTVLMHLNYSWNWQRCRNRRFEVSFQDYFAIFHRLILTSADVVWRYPFYVSSEMNRNPWIILLSCGQCSTQRKRCLQIPLRNLGLPSCSTVLISLGASVSRYSHRSV